MPKQPETLFKEKIKPLLEAIPCSWWTKISQRSIRGTPDFLGCIRGHFVALELKKSKADTADPLQRWNLARIQNLAGGLSFVVCPENWEEVYAVLRKIP